VLLFGRQENNVPWPELRWKTSRPALAKPGAASWQQECEGMRPWPVARPAGARSCQVWARVRPRWQGLPSPKGSWGSRAQGLRLGASPLPVARGCWPCFAVWSLAPFAPRGSRPFLKKNKKTKTLNTRKNESKKKKIKKKREGHLDQSSSRPIIP